MHLSKSTRRTLCLLLSLIMVLSVMAPAVSAAPADPDMIDTAAERAETEGYVNNDRGVNNSIIIDTDATGGYEGDYVVIYNPATSSSTSYSTGTMTGLIETTVNPNVTHRQPSGSEQPFYKIDVDPLMEEAAKTAEVTEEPLPTRASYNVGDTKTFKIYQTYSPTGSSSVSFECLYVGSHCYIWTPVSSANNTYPLDEIDSSFAAMAAAEFDSKFDLMQSSFGNHTNGSSGDGKLHMLYYNINDGWQPGQGYVAGFFYQVDISNNGLPILNIDTYPGVYYKNSAGTEYKRMDDTYNTMVHEYQHLINYSNTSGMSTWLNECFSAAAEEICYPGSSVVGRIQSWENYYYSDNGDWLNPPAEFEYQSSFNLHKGYSLYSWDNNIDDILALYSQVSFFAQYLFTRFGNTIYKQISNKYSSSETSAITSATGVSCADLVRDFRVAVTANAAQDQYGGIYGFKVQDGYDPDSYNGVQNPYDLLSPIVFTGSSCSIKGGGSITVKPVNGVYNPPSGASSSLKYIGIKLASPYTVTAVSNNDAWGTVSVDGSTIICTPAEGYYASGYEVVSGEATATISGNTVTVSAASDCTIRVIFAVKPLLTVNYVASGQAQGTVTAYVNDVITLPDTVSATAEGWTFTGWMDHQIEETTDKPAYYAPGASYTVTDNATLYAVYTHVEEGGSVVYELLTAAPSDWAGNYVITNNATSTSGMYVLKGITGSASGTDAESANNCTVFASTGITLDGTTMSNVHNDYVITLEANGSYYTVKSAGTGCYYGMNSSSYLYAYSSINTTYCRWTPAINSSGIVQLKNSANGSYPYFSWSTGNNYFWSGSTSNANVLKLYKEANGSTTYYWTDPVQHEHNPAAAVEENRVEPTCTAAGSYDSVVYCSECGEELSRETVAIPALGHQPGEALQENYVEPTATVAGGYDMVVYCQRCNAELSREHTELPATMNGYFLIRPEWTVTDIDENEVFAENANNQGEYMLTTDLAEGDKIKVVHVTNGAIDAWYPNGTGNEYTVDAAHAGTKTVYFKTNYQNDWSQFGGYIWIDANTEPEPQYNGSLQMYYSFTLGEEISSVYTIMASSVGSYVDYYVVVERDGAEPVELHKEDMAAYGTTAFRATYNGIAAKEMNVAFTATLYAVDAQGQVFYGPSMTKTVKGELKTRLEATTNPAVMRTLCADMLNYGAAAQVYFGYDTDNLVNTGVEYIHDFETAETPAAVNHQGTTGEGGNLFPSASLSSRVVLQISAQMPNGSDVKLKVMDEEGNVLDTLDTTVVNANLFKVNFDRVGAKNMRTLYKFQFVDEGGVSADSKVLTWSVESFVAQKLASNEPGSATYEMARALLIYGDSAAAYLENQ